MKTIIRKILCLLTCFLLLLMVGCSSLDSDYKDEGPLSTLPESDSSIFSKDYFYSKEDSRSDYDESYGYLDELYNKYPFPKAYFDKIVDAGLLTASVVFDNDAYDYWTGLITSSQQGLGVFADYSKTYEFKTNNRMRIQVKDAPNVKVELTNEKLVTFTDANGYAYFFSNKPFNESNEISITYYDKNNEKKIFNTICKNNDVIKLNDTTKKEDVIELMFVVDTTGSMGDELEYLKKEIDYVIQEVNIKNPNSKVKLALMFYRDFGDEYVTRYYNFTEDILLQKRNLEKQSANGGGDFEEAVYKALGEACNAKWSEKSETRIIVHVADAPSHDKDVEKWNDTTLEFASKGVKIITVASSGINKKTEYFFRSQSLITGGAYVFLTDDSGIGEAHLEATTKEKPVVEYLTKLLIRLINGYHTGDFGVAERYDGTINPSSLPEEMPRDLNIVFKWFGDEESTFNLKTRKLTLISGHDQKEYIIEITDEELNYIYTLLRQVNLDDVKQSNNSNGNSLYLKVSYGNYDKEVLLSFPDRILKNKVDYTFYLICNRLYIYLMNKTIEQSK